MKRCLQCNAALVGKRASALYCQDACGRSYRAQRVHMSDASREFWKGVRRAKTRGTSPTWHRRRAVGFNQEAES